MHKINTKSLKALPAALVGVLAMAAPSFATVTVTAPSSLPSMTDQLDTMTNIQNLFSTAAVDGAAIFGTLIVVGAGIWAVRHLQHLAAGKAGAR